MARLPFTRGFQRRTLRCPIVGEALHWVYCKFSHAAITTPERERLRMAQSLSLSGQSERYFASFLPQYPLKDDFNKKYFSLKNIILICNFFKNWIFFHKNNFMMNFVYCANNAFHIAFGKKSCCKFIYCVFSIFKLFFV